jgi:hypothetical protein
MENNTDMALARWQRLRHHPLLHRSADLPLSTRARKAREARRMEPIPERWRGTTPQGREIMRKWFYEIEIHEMQGFAVANRQILALRSLVPEYGQLLEVSQSESPERLNASLEGSVQALIQAERAPELLRAWEVLETAFAESNVYFNLEWFEPELRCWGMLADLVPDDIPCAPPPDYC